MTDELRVSQVGQNDPAAAIADVVFVHGLGGDDTETWQVDGDASTYWPAWLEADLAGVSVWALQYPAGKFRWSASGAEMSLPDRGRAILDLLVSKGIGTRPLFFIAHSLGGLIVKQILRLASEMNVEAWKELAANTRGIVFLATPHSGSRLGTLASALGSLGVSISATQLSDNDPHLRDLNEWYQQNARSNGYATSAYYEMKKTAKFLIVDQASANPGVEGCVPIPCDCNHIDICKPRARTSPIYAGTLAFVKRHVAADRRSLSEHSSSSPLDLATDTLSEEFEAEYEFYTSSSDGEVKLDLAEKLRQGGRAHEIKRATHLKEQFAKQFVRHQLQPSAIRRYVKLLAEVDSRFNNYVFPRIAEGAGRAEISELVRKSVTDPILDASGPDDDFVNAAIIDRVIYYLTGLCHIRWTP